MNKLTFDTSREAKEYIKFARSHGYRVSEPIREKRAKGARRIYDLNGKPVKYQWKVLLGTRGVGKRGGASKEEHWEEMKRTSLDIDEFDIEDSFAKGDRGKKNGKEETIEAAGRHIWMPTYGELN